MLAEPQAVEALVKGVVAGRWLGRGGGGGGGRRRLRRGLRGLRRGRLLRLLLAGLLGQAGLHLGEELSGPLVERGLGGLLCRLLQAVVG